MGRGQTKSSPLVNGTTVFDDCRGLPSGKLLPKLPNELERSSMFNDEGLGGYTK